MAVSDSQSEAHQPIDLPSVEMRRPKRWDEPFSREMDNATVDKVLEYEPFKTARARYDKRAYSRLRDLLRYDCAYRECRSGEILIREADYGTSAFFILEGAVQVVFTHLQASLLGRREVKRRTILQLIEQVFRRRRWPEARDISKYPQFQKEERTTAWQKLLRNWIWVGGGETDKSSRRIASSDQPELHFLKGYPEVLRKEGIDRLTQSVYAGEVAEAFLFGEIGALARIPRTATIVAGRAKQGDEEEVHLLLEARWQGFRDIMKFFPDIEKDVMNKYRANCRNRVLESGIFKVIQDLDETAKEAIRASSKVQLYGDFQWSVDYEAILKKDPQERLKAELIIAQEGNEPSGVFFLMSGFGRLSERHGNGEQTISYIGPRSYTRWANHFGLRETYHNWANRHEPVRLQHTLRAVGYALTVFVPSAVLEKHVFDKLPEDKRPPPFDTMRVAQVPAAVRGASRRERERDRTGLLEFLVESRVINGTKTMVIDLDRCTRCDDCVRACAATHDNNPRFLRHGIKYEQYMIANACMHCADPVCMIGCPTGAIHRVAADGEVIINDLTCIGCSMCANNCPYENIRMVPIRDLSGEPVKMWAKATKCDLCVDQLGGPACQRACPHDALVRIDTTDLGPLDAWIDR